MSVEKHLAVLCFCFKMIYRKIYLQGLFHRLILRFNRKKLYSSRSFYPHQKTKGSNVNPQYLKAHCIMYIQAIRTHLLCIKKITVQTRGICIKFKNRHFTQPHCFNFLSYFFAAKIAKFSQLLSLPFMVFAVEISLSFNYNPKQRPKKNKNRIFFVQFKTGLLCISLII